MDDVEFVDIRISKFEGSGTAVALQSTGKIFSWGDNQFGQLGHGDLRSRKLPTQLQSLKRKQVSEVQLGHKFCLMLGRDISLAEHKIRKERKIAR